MAIRRRFNKPKRIWYHRQYGSVRNPPITDNGDSKFWPNGTTISYAVPRFKGNLAVIGWVCYQRGTKGYGIWVCTKPKMTERTRAVDGTWKFHSWQPESTPYYRLLNILSDAYADEHDLIM